MMSSWTSVAVWMNSITDAVPCAVARIAGHACTPSAAQPAESACRRVLDYWPIVGYVDLRLDAANRFPLDFAKVVANRLEHLGESAARGLFAVGFTPG